MTDDTGVSQREHLESVERQTGRTPKELQGPDFPDLLEYIWSAFIHLSSLRGQGFSGPLPIDYRTISDWMDLTGIKLSAWEVDTILRLDKVYRRILNG